MKGKKTGGRTAGTPNKISQNLREMLRQFTLDNFEAAMKCWEAIDDPKDRFKLYLEAMKFNLPMLQQIQMDDRTSRKTYAEELAEAEESEIK